MVRYTSLLSEGMVPFAVRFSCRNVNKVDRWGVGVGVRNKHVNGRDIFRLSFVLKSNHSGHGTANRVQEGVMGKEWEGGMPFVSSFPPLKV